MVDILIAAVAIIILFIVLLVLKKTISIFATFFKIFSVLLVLLLIGVIVFGYFVIRDANNFKNNFMNTPSLFLMKQGSGTNATILAGAVVNPDTKTFEPLDASKLSQIQGIYDAGNISGMNIEYMEIFVIDSNAINRSGGASIKDQNLNLTSSEIDEVMLSSDSRDTLASIVAQKSSKNKSEVLSSLSASSVQVRDYIFSYYLSSLFNPDHTAGLLLDIKDGSVRVYGSSMLFTAIKMLPSSLLSSVAKSIENQTRGVIGNSNFGSSGLANNVTSSARVVG